MNTVRIYSQNKKESLPSAESCWLTADWKLPRKLTLTYQTKLDGEDAAEEAFTILNAPPRCLTPEQKVLQATFASHSLSVGDVVEVSGPSCPSSKEFLCAPSGWITSPSNEKNNLLLGGEKKTIDVHLYKNGQTALSLTSEDGQPYAVISLCLPNETAQKNEVFLKNYSEGRGIPDLLIQAGLGIKTGSFSLNDFGSEVVVMEITDGETLEKLEKLHALQLKKDTPQKRAYSCPQSEEFSSPS